ncbi:MAG: gliding motility-associated C-terminal domain-containing protein [Bacteroidales bacterium]
MNEAYAQALYNNGVNIKVTKGVTVFVNGIVQNQAGNIDVDAVSGNSELLIQDDFINNATAGGDGYYRVFGDWINNNTFNAGSGTVFLEGDAQTLGGTVSTIFNNLTLDGSGVKTQAIDQYCTGILNLNNVELNTDVYGFYVQNTDVNAITLGTGFVSSLNGGFLSRMTNSASAYLFPVGSSAGTLRYRPVELTPDGSVNTFTVRMANTDATSEGYDVYVFETGICEINPLFYHQINRTAGTSAVDLSIYYDDATDGSWQGISNWSTSPNQWEIITGSSTVSGTPLFKAFTTGWNDFSDIPYALYISTPVADAGTDVTMCEGENVEIGGSPTASGGSGSGYTYVWSPSTGLSSTTVANPIASPASTTTYTIVVTDGSGCTASDNVLVTVNPVPAVLASSNEPICEGGDIHLTESGGEATTWSWTGPDSFTSAANNPDIIGATTDATGWYYVEVDNGTGCTNLDSTYVNVYTNPPVNATSNSPVCEGGDLNLEENGGAASSWSWSGPDTFSSTDHNPTITSVFMGVNDGIYEVTATDANGCTNTDTTEVIIYKQPSAVAVSNSPVCEGEDLILNETGSDAVAWSWSGPDGFTSTNHSPVISGASSENAGTYSVTITDANGCTVSDNVDVTVNPNPVTPTVNIDCTGGENAGIIEVTAPLGGEYEYTVDGTYQTSTDIGPLTNGTYTVTVMNTTTGCTSSGTPVNLDCGCSNPTSLTLSSTSGETCDLLPVTVSGNTFGGSATAVNLSHDGNGTLDATYFASSPFDFTYTPDATDEGTDVTITVETNNPEGAPCTSSLETYVLTVYPIPVATAGSDSPVCEGEDINLTESAGDATSWSWSGPDTFTSPDHNPVISGASSVNAGTYSVTITDVNGCTNSDDVDVIVNPLPVATASSNSPVCEGEDLILNETGGEAATWSWTGPGGFTSGDQNPTITGVTTAAGGTYTVEITDANGCTNTDDVSITINSAPPIPIVNTDCPGGEDSGTIEVTAPTGGDYQYSIDGTYQASTSFGPLTNGTYTVTVQNTTTGCTTAGNVIDLSCGSCTNPPTLTLSSNTATVCGANPVTISGNTFGGGATEVTLGHDGSGSLDATTSTTSPFDFTYTPDPADAGNDVTITITTNNPEGAPCTPAGETFTLTVYPMPNVVAGSNSPVCAGEDILLTETGGSADSWSWSGPDGFSSPDHSPTITGVTTGAGGTYTVEITDANGCTNTDDVVVTVNAAPATPTVSTDCSGGEDEGIIEVTAPLGADYQYSIDGTYQASTSFGPLTNGTYTVTVQNTTTGCTTAGNVIDLSCGSCTNPPTLTLSSNTATVCGANPVTISGNTFGGGATEVTLGHDGSGSLDATTSTTSPFDFTYTPDPADAGNDVTITITTNNPEGAPCTPAGETFTLTVYPMPNVVAGSNSPVCAGEDILLTETGDSADSWSWSGPDGFTSTEQNPTISGATASAGGLYSVTVTGNNGCTAEDNVTVQVITVSPGITDPGNFCYHDDPVNLEATPTGGTWSGTGIIDTSAGTFDPAQADIGFNTISYEVTEFGCTGQTSIDIQVYENADATIEDPGDFCSDDDTVVLTAANTGGTWTGDGVDPVTGVFDPVDAGTGTHEIIYTISGNCGDADTVYITVHPRADATIIDPVDSMYVDEPPVVLEAVDDGGEWSGNGIDTYSGEFNPADAGIGDHQITYTINQVCGDADSTTIVVGPEQIKDLLIPDVLTPNDDGYNDTWRIQGIRAYDDVAVYIFNRWGDKVFEFTGTGSAYYETQNQWDGTRNGKKLPLGTYVYILELNSGDSYKGTVTLIY